MSDSRHLLRTALCAGPLLLSPAAHAMMDDDPVLYSLNAHEFEFGKESGEATFNWDVTAWMGTTRDRLVARTEGEDGEVATEEFETLLLYSRALAPFWNVNAGWRGDWQPGARRNWATVELEGIAPGFIESRLSLLASSEGRLSARAEFQAEWFLTQNWQLIPRLETDWFSEPDVVNEREDGLAALELGLRFAYVIRQDLRPYVGLQWNLQLGDSRDLARAAGESPNSLQVVAGLAFWF
ncbi:MAG: copper resistance protein B [Gammaproteobacteria bacterium]|jgi:copper resistance protein B|nr:copper resistance protein B [Gammaproteobacteria bacterium]